MSPRQTWLSGRVDLILAELVQRGLSMPRANAAEAIRAHSVSVAITASPMLESVTLNNSRCSRSCSSARLRAEMSTLICKMDFGSPWELRSRIQ